MRQFSIICILAFGVSGLVPGAADSLPPPPLMAYSVSYVPACESKTVQIYFPVGESFLTPQADHALTTLQADIHNCDLQAVRLTSISADGRTDAEIETLAQERLSMIEARFDKSGLAPAVMSAELQMPTSTPKVTKPMQRRVAVFLDLEPEAAG